MLLLVLLNCVKQVSKRSIVKFVKNYRLPSKSLHRAIDVLVYGNDHSVRNLEFICHHIQRRHSCCMLPERERISTHN